MQKYYGQQTDLALKNFPFSIHPTRKELIHAIVLVKKAAAKANYQAENFEKAVRDGIVESCDQVLAGEYLEQFVTPALQGGAGTSINMNVNEVIASLATELLEKKGESISIHPNDHVNCSQSTNDVNPSALKIACLRLLDRLIASVETAERIFSEKASAFVNITKLGRTHIQDAVPTTLGAEFRAYAAVMKRHAVNLESQKQYLYELNLGGTAIGNAVNASERYREFVYQILCELTKLPLKPAENLMSQTSSQTDFVRLSQAIVALALDFSKIASDLRLLSSGPNGGLGEITLPNMQAGSSIMPGKINPVLPESANQLYFLVSGNNLTIEQAAHGSQLELGVMFPILADRLLESLILAGEVIENTMLQCVLHITANEDRCLEHLEKSTAYATLLTPILGYDTVSQAVKEAIAQKKTLREVIVGKKLLDEKAFEETVSQ